MIGAWRKERFGKGLLTWHRDNKQLYPWRDSKDPYVVLTSEILLRKTTREQVAKVFPLFLKLYPNAKSLVLAKRRDLEELLKPLGMWRKRALLLQELGRALYAQKGEVPSSAEELLELPGVGRYAANATLCFAFDKQVPLIDTNVVRVIKRVFSVKSSKKREREDQDMWNLAGSLIPKGRAREFNLAVLDFADTVCLLRKPKCSYCWMSPICDYYSNTIATSRSS